MVHVSIIIITFKRAVGLARLLKALNTQELNSSIGPIELEIVVIDNDLHFSALPVVEDFKKSSRVKIFYFQESKLGIPVARNKGLNSISQITDFVCFIDDDEWPESDWLSCLLKCQEINNADSVLSGVKPIFEQGSNSLIIKSRLYDGWNYPCNTPIFEAATNNVLIRYKFIVDNNLWFDERMLRTGGSDYLFFKLAVRLGMKIYWTDEAYVSESIPKSRANMGWLIKRQFRLGNTFSVAGRLLDGAPSLPLLFINALFRFLIGLFLIPLIVISVRIGFKGFSMIIRSVGMLYGVFGGSHQEYSGSSLIRDRSSG